MNVKSVANCSIRKIQSGLIELSLLGENVSYSVVNKVQNLKKNKKVREYSALSNAMNLVEDTGLLKTLSTYVHNLGNEYPENELSYEDLEEIVRIGKTEGKLAAVKRYKEITGESLMVSKNAVEDYFRERCYEFKKFE